jgi:hypothetical protein
VVTAQAAAAQTSTAGQNPHIAAWYRRQYAGGEFIQYPPKQQAEVSCCLMDHGLMHWRCNGSTAAACIQRMFRRGGMQRAAMFLERGHHHADCNP